MDHVQAVLEPGPAVRDLAEVVEPGVLLALEQIRAVVGRDRLEDVRPHRVPENLLVFLRPGRRCVDVLRALEVGPVEERLVDEEVLGAGLAPDVPALVAGERDRLGRFLARDVDDVERRAGHACQLDGAVRRLTLELRRTGQRVVARRGVSRRDGLGHQDLDRVSVLGVHHDERTGLGGNLHHLEQRLVVDHERVFVGHEELVGRDAVLLRQSRELFECPALMQVGDCDVEAVVDQRLAFALAVPDLEGLGEGLTFALDAEVDVRGRSAEGGGGLTRLEVVDRRLASPRHLEVRMRIDSARQHVLP